MLRDDFVAASAMFTEAHRPEPEHLSAFRDHMRSVTHSSNYLDEHYVVGTPGPNGTPLQIKTASSSLSLTIPRLVREAFVAIEVLPFTGGERMAIINLTREDSGWEFLGLNSGAYTYGKLEAPQHYQQARKALAEGRAVDAFLHAGTGHCLEQVVQGSYPADPANKDLLERSIAEIGKLKLIVLEDVPSRPQLAHAMAERYPGFAASPAQLLRHAVRADAPDQDPIFTVQLDR